MGSRCGQYVGMKHVLIFVEDAGMIERVNWGWGLSLIVLTMAVHATCLVMLALVAVRTRARLHIQDLRSGYLIAIVIGAVGTVGLLLVVVHGIEAAMWAVAYLWVGALDSPLDAMLYSVDTMATRGASGVTLEMRWQMMGALEAVDGVLLFGITTAYMFSMIQVYWHLLAPRSGATS
jgi:hypothetical protein